MDKHKFCEDVAREIVKLIALRGATYEDAELIFEIAAHKMQIQMVQFPADD